MQSQQASKSYKMFFNVISANEKNLLNVDVTVIAAIERPEFENGLRTGVLPGGC